MKRFIDFVLASLFRVDHNTDFDPKNVTRDVNELLGEVKDELYRGFLLMTKHPKSVSIFGSARFKQDEEFAVKARALGKKIAEETGYTVITGGGPGIMEAANCGAAEGGGKSVGLSIRLSSEQKTNPCVGENANFTHFFTRKTILTFSAETYIFFPGGFGTLDEFFDIITLVQTKKIPRVPIVLFGKSYWNDVHEFIEKHMYEELQTIDRKDLKLYHITDDMDEVIQIIKAAPVREWWDHYEK